LFHTRKRLTQDKVLKCAGKGQTNVDRKRRKKGKNPYIVKKRFYLERLARRKGMNQSLERKSGENLNDEKKRVQPFSGSPGKEGKLDGFKEEGEKVHHGKIEKNSLRRKKKRNNGGKGRTGGPTPGSGDPSFEKKGGGHGNEEGKIGPSRLQKKGKKGEKVLFNKTVSYTPLRKQFELQEKRGDRHRHPKTGKGGEKEQGGPLLPSWCKGVSPDAIIAGMKGQSGSPKTYQRGGFSNFQNKVKIDITPGKDRRSQENSSGVSSKGGGGKKGGKG